MIHINASGIDIDLKNSYFSSRDEDRSVVLDRIVSFYTRCGETVVFPILYSQDTAFNCMSIGREMAGFMIADKSVVYTAGGQIIKKKTSVGSVDSIKGMLSGVKNRVMLLYCDPPGLATSPNFGLPDSYDAFISVTSGMFANLFESVLLPGGNMILLAQNAVVDASGNTLPVAFDMFKEIDNIFRLRYGSNGVTFKGDRIWLIDGKDQSADRSCYTCRHRYLMIWRKNKQ